MTSDWPPLITDARRPRWIIWRDRILTVLVWALFLALFINQCLALRARIHAHLADPTSEWDFLLRPFLIVAGILVLWLGASGAATYGRAVRNRRRPAPPPLVLDAEAAHLGIAPADLMAARQGQIIAVTIEPDGRFRFETVGPIYTEPAAGRDPPAQPLPDRSVPGR